MRDVEFIEKSSVETWEMIHDFQDLLDFHLRLRCKTEKIGSRMVHPPHFMKITL